MSATAPTVLAIGTCRIFRPLRHMDAAGLINLRHYGKTPNWWFTHSAGEGIQYLRTLAGDLDIPMNLRHLTCETTMELPPDLSAPESLRDIDLVVVEISTFKKLHMNGFRLNFQNVWGYAKRANVPTGDVLTGKVVEWPDGVEPLTGLSADKSTKEEVMGELLEIQRMTGAPMLTVDHIHSLTAAGEPIPGRPEITGLLKEFESAHGVPFHSTRPLIEECGSESALADDNHYRKEFEVVAGESLYGSIQRTLKMSPAGLL